ncbi:MAG: GNAT family N-acetyltransferase [Roseburia sp.]|nr:GNAT family N-acetyltransferase [Roseburia sp.]
MENEKVELSKYRIEQKCMEITCRYYSKWLGQDGILLRDLKGVTYLYSEERNHVPYGYGAAFDLYVFYQKERIVISYGDKVKGCEKILKSEIDSDMSAIEVKQVLERVLGKKADHNVKYIFAGHPVSDFGAKVLVEEDYNKYENFWRKCHPGCENTEWLKEYFDEMIRERMCIGYLSDDILVSCTDAPGMPYMEHEVQEIGINTLSEFQKKGYASAVCQKCLCEILRQGKVPQWSCGIGNQASKKLAEKVGFVEFAEVISMTV